MVRQCLTYWDNFTGNRENGNSLEVTLFELVRHCLTNLGVGFIKIPGHLEGCQGYAFQAAPLEFAANQLQQAPPVIGPVFAFLLKLNDVIADEPIADGQGRVHALNGLVPHGFVR